MSRETVSTRGEGITPEVTADAAPYTASDFALVWYLNEGMWHHFDRPKFEGRIAEVMNQLAARGPQTFDELDPDMDEPETYAAYECAFGHGFISITTRGVIGEADYDWVIVLNQPLPAEAA
jgi:hypothetical protein